MPRKKVLGRRRSGSRSRAGIRSAINSRNMAFETLEDRRLLAFDVPDLNIPGMGFTGPSPPDVVGDVGEDYYIQMVNDISGSIFTIYDKTDGSVVSGPTTLSDFSSGGQCVAGAGDPIVVYDELADRWVLTEFAFPNQLCVYVSETGDVTDNRWFDYEIDTPNFPDYPKYGVWNDAYYVTTNEASGPAVYALDRENMLQGNPLRPYQRFSVPRLDAFGFQTLTPADVDGQAPPDDSPGIFMRHRDDEAHDIIPDPFRDFLEIYEFDVDWDNPLASTFGLVEEVPVAEFDSELCGFTAFACFPQFGTNVTLDPLRETIMWRLQYRNFGDYETLVGNLVTDINDTDTGGVKWFELQKTDTDWGLFQEGLISSFEVPGRSRWMGSIAMDEVGNIAVGYSTTSASSVPDLRYTGRLSTAPLGTMQNENILYSGPGASLSNRWGDYFAMSVDPVQPCTFWFTGQYAESDGSWGTRISSFAFDQCEVPPPEPPPTEPGIGTITGIKWNDLDGDGELDDDEPGIAGFYIYLDIDGDNSIDLGEPAAVTDENGFYSIEVDSGDYIVREVMEPGWMQTSPVDGEWEITVIADEELPDINFGNTKVSDLGDAPAPYPTLIADDGASHGVLPGFHLGESIDGEPDGIPETDALGDDSNNLDDEDGVAFPWALFAGFDGTVDVTVSTGGYSPGVLNAWLDFNMDGDWSDAGEQIASDLVLDDGTHTLAFDVPLNAVVGNTFARFRYGYTRGIGPTGADWAGEIEDHQLLVLEDQPNAVDDQFEIAQDSVLVPLDVLDNDFPSSTGSLTIERVTQPARATVTISPDGQELFITPDRGAFSPPNQLFTYTIDDGTGKESTANVTVFIQPDIVAPVAIDDTFYEAVTNQPLDVMANDLPGAAGVIDLVSFTLPANGTAVRDDNGTPGDLTDDTILYTPGIGFEGFDEFEYTIGNVEGESTATVTILGDNPNALVALDLSLADLDGNPLPGPLTVGEEFLLIGTSRDLRAFQVAPGVFAVYLDLLYSRDVALPNLDPANDLGFEITFSYFDPLDPAQGGYFNGESGDADLPAIIDEVGAFWAGIPDQPDRPLEVFRIAFTATGIGTATFQGNPADDLPGNDVLLFNPPVAVPPSEVLYGFAAVDIVQDGFNGGGGEGEAMDVNRDGFISAIDALLVINNLNLHGSRPTGEGEAGGDIPVQRLDVNRDSYISAIDALLVINHLNGDAGLGEGEGEGESGAVREARPELDGSSGEILLTNQDSESILEEEQLFNSAARSQSNAAVDWRLNIGEESQADLSAADADEISEEAWEALLEDLAEDALDALLDPEDR